MFSGLSIHLKKSFGFISSSLQASITFKPLKTLSETWASLSFVGVIGALLAFSSVII
jgi:hypothetical protein